MRKMTKNQREVMELLTRPGTGYVSPTRIAQAIHPGTGLHSAWASPICKRLVAKGLATRSERGWYAAAVSRDEAFGVLEESETP